MTEAITTITTLVGNVLTLIEGNGVLMVCLCASLFSMAIGFVRRLVGRY